MKQETMTIVYTINDKESFKEEREHIKEHFKSSKGEKWAITAMSCGHELHRLYLLEEANSEERYDLFDEIFGIVNPSDYAEVSDLDGY